MQRLLNFTIFTAITLSVWLISMPLSFAATPGTIKWTFNLQEIIVGAPVVGPDGTIYVNTVAQHLWAINPDGTKKWIFQTLYVPNGKPFVDNQGDIFVTSTSGDAATSTLEAITSSGTRLWQYNLACSFFGNKALEPIGNKQGLILANTACYTDLPTIPSNWQILNSTTGQVVYQKNSANSSTNEPFFDQASNLFIQTSQDKAEFIGLQKYYTVTPNSVLPVELSSAGGNGNGRIYFTDSLGNLRAYNAINQQLIWKIALGKNFSQSTPVIASDGTIYVTSHDGELYALLSNGAIKWLSPVDKTDISQKVSLDADGTIYVIPESGNVYAFASNGSRKWQQAVIKANTPAAISSDGTIYVGTSANTIVAINGESHG